MGHPLEQLDPSDRAIACQPVAGTHLRVGSDDPRLRALPLIVVDGAQARMAGSHVAATGLMDSRLPIGGPGWFAPWSTKDNQ